MKKPVKVAPRILPSPEQKNEQRGGAGGSRKANPPRREKFTPVNALPLKADLEHAPEPLLEATLAGPEASKHDPEPVNENEFTSEDFFRLFPEIAARPVSIGIACLVGLAACIATALFAFSRGSDAGRAALLREQTAADFPITDNAIAEINAAYALMEAGKPREAADAFASLQLQYPSLQSITYLEALAALRSRQDERAETRANQSVAKKERVADSLAIIALIQANRGEKPDEKKLGDPRLRAELTFRQAIASDVATPYPFIELAGLLRLQGKTAEAILALESAARRVQPVEMAPYVLGAIELTRLGNLPDWDLPPVALAPRDSAAAFASAYIAMRKGDFVQAASLLEIAREKTSPEVYRQLSNDPAFRAYRTERKLAQFFDN